MTLPEWYMELPERHMELPERNMGLPECHMGFPERDMALPECLIRLPKLIKEELVRLVPLYLLDLIWITLAMDVKLEKLRNRQWGDMSFKRDLMLGMK